MIKKGDFIELDYEGYLVDNNQLFDTTKKAVAEKAGLVNKENFEPNIVCIGQNHLLPGLDEFVEGKDLGNYEVEVTSEEAFGKRNAKLLQLIPLKKFKDQKIQPFQGLELNIDGHLGIVRSISGGRVIVDFNHPLAGKDLKYKLDLKRIVVDLKEQVEAILKLGGLPFEKVELIKEGDKAIDHAIIHMKQLLPNEFNEGIQKTIKELTKVGVVSFQANNQANK